MTDLLSCPFCGGEALHIYPASGAGQYVTCAKCFAATGQNREDPVTAWNTRHPSRNDVLEEALWDALCWIDRWDPEMADGAAERFGLDLTRRALKDRDG